MKPPNYLLGAPELTQHSDMVGKKYKTKNGHHLEEGIKKWLSGSGLSGSDIRDNLTDGNVGKEA